MVFNELNFMAISVGPHPDTDNIMDPKPIEGEEQAKKRRGRKKSKLEDMFPAYLQVCNFRMPQFLILFFELAASSCVKFVSLKFVIHYRRLSLGRH